MKRLPLISTERALKVLGGRWKAVILYRLQTGPLRFSSLERLLAEVSQKVLTKQLRELEEHGLIERRAIERSVSYGLTGLGRSALPLIRELSEWGRVHADELGEPIAPRCERPA